LARFGASVCAAATRCHDHAAALPQRNSLTRHACRSGTAAAFAYDDVAVATTLEALARGDDAALTAAEMQFLLLPLMHSESAEHQAESVKRFTALADSHRAYR
jgi:uncharacterized protein (DUF924 family)